MAFVTSDRVLRVPSAQVFALILYGRPHFKKTLILNNAKAVFSLAWLFALAKSMLWSVVVNRYETCYSI